MSHVQKWWSRAAAAVTGIVLTLVVPAHAWAVSTGADQLVIEAARSRRRGGSMFFIIGAICCLVVVGGIVLAVLMISRNRKRKGPGQP